MPNVTYHVDRAVAVITFANPPVNGLSHAVRAGIGAALDRTAADTSVRAVVHHRRRRTLAQSNTYRPPPVVAITRHIVTNSSS